MATFIGFNKKLIKLVKLIDDLNDLAKYLEELEKTAQCLSDINGFYSADIAEYAINYILDLFAEFDIIEADIDKREYTIKVDNITLDNCDKIEEKLNTIKDDDSE